MNYITFNAVIMPLFAVALIPTAIRNRKSGEYLGFYNINILIYLIVILILQSFFMIDEFGIELHTFFRIFGITAMPFVGGYAYVVLTHKQLFGEEFNRQNKNGS